MTDLKIDDKTKNVIRIGKLQEEKNRPIKITLRNLEDKEKINTNLKNLKSIEKYKRISITNDYTLTQRKIINEWIQKEKEPTDSKVAWRVRGSPEKRIYLKKFVLIMDMTTKTNQRVTENKVESNIKECRYVEKRKYKK